MLRYYDVASTDVDWTSLIYMIVYIPLIFPGAWIMDKVASTYNIMVILFFLNVITINTYYRVYGGPFYSESWGPQQELGSKY